VDLTRQLLPYGKGGGFNRSAHSAGPGTCQRAEGRGQREEGRGTKAEGRGVRAEGRGKREEAGL